MKKFAILSFLFFSIAVGLAWAAQTGEKIFYQYGCTCHHPTKNFTFGNLGPSLQKIQTAYNGNSQQLQKYLKGKSNPIMDPARANIMKEPLNKIKNLSPQETQLLADFIMQR